jgi:hypothetical protein
MAKWLPACSELVHLLIWIAIMLWIASRPTDLFFAPEAKTFFGIPRWFVQYPYHAGASFILAILFRRYFSALGAPTGRQAWLLSLLGVVGVSMACEMMQMYVPTRGASLRDVAVDLCGGALAVASRQVACFRGWTS